MPLARDQFRGMRAISCPDSVAQRSHSGKPAGSRTRRPPQRRQAPHDVAGLAAVRLTLPRVHGRGERADAFDLASSHTPTAPDSCFRAMADCSFSRMAWISSNLLLRARDVMKLSTARVWCSWRRSEAHDSRRTRRWFTATAQYGRHNDARAGDKCRASSCVPSPRNYQVRRRTNARSHGSSAAISRHFYRSGNSAGD